MNVEFQVKMVGYQDVLLRREIGRVARRHLAVGRWKYVLYLIGRVAAIISGAFGGLLLISLVLGLVVVLVQYNTYYAQLGVEPLSTFVGPLISGFIVALVTLAPMAAILWHRYDPLREYLWPKGAALVTVTFCPDFFQVDEPYFTGRVDYHAVQAVNEAAWAFYLFLCNGQVLMLRKREFVLGSPEQFRDYIAAATGLPVEYIKA